MINLDLTKHTLHQPTSITYIDEIDDFYDITVEDNHTFYVTDDENNSLILTHNCDGSHITGLILAFFYHFWKELFEMGVIYKAETPIIVAKKYDSKGSKVIESLNFYTMEEYNNWTTNNNTTKYEVSYKKGLSSLEDDEYREIIQNPRLTQFIIDDDGQVKESVYTWFGKESNNMADKKEILLNL